MYKYIHTTHCITVYTHTHTHWAPFKRVSIYPNQISTFNFKTKFYKIQSYVRLGKNINIFKSDKQ